MLHPVPHALICAILDRPRAHEWTTMGFGMIRTYLDPAHRWRLNIWDDRLQVPGVSTIHDHPWSFTSWGFAGTLYNTRFEVHDLGTTSRVQPTHCYQDIKTGEGGGPVGGTKLAILKRHNIETILPGQSYTQRLDEVHETTFERGTVTLNDRSAPTEAYTARVFWPHGEKWVDAMPRLALAREIDDAVEMARILLDGDARLHKQRRSFAYHNAKLSNPNVTESMIVDAEKKLDDPPFQTSQADWDSLEPNSVIDAHAAASRIP